MNNTRHYAVNANFAKRNNLPTSFVGVALKETERAVYVYGHGEVDPRGRCCRCGRTLTHPGSILLGIGPDCIGDWGLRDIKMNNMSMEDKVKLKRLIHDQVVDSWIPKGVIKLKTESDQEVVVPATHKMLNGTHDMKKTKRAVVKDDQLIITFPFNRDTLVEVKSLAGRKWNPDRKEWTCPFGATAVKSLRSWGFEIIGLKQDHLEEVLDSVHQDITKVVPVKIPGMKLPLYPYQGSGVGFLDKNRGRGLIGDEMGLGKTVQALGYLQLHPKKRPAIILCPASLKKNWKREIRKFMGVGAGKAEILEGRKPYDVRGEILIINYDILAYWYKFLQQFKPQVIIADECHFFMNNKAQRTKAVKMLAKGVPHFIALSGTPIVNKPIEIYNAVKLVDPSFMDFWHFAKRYCGAHHNGYGWQFGGASNTKELHDKLNGKVMIRRLKKDVLKELPAKVRSFVPFDIDNWSEYAAADKDFLTYLKNTKGEEAAEKASGAIVLTQIEALKQVAVKGKMKAVIEWSRNVIDSGEKLVLFATHKFVIDELMKEFGDVAVKIDGSISPTKRQAVVDRFQNDPKIKLFIGNYIAAGVGITLTSATNVGLVEFPWTPGAVEQAIDRLHRIGQKGNVTAYYLMAEGTIEESLVNLLDAKRQVLDQVLDGKETEDKDLIKELINNYYKKIAA